MMNENGCLDCKQADTTSASTLAGANGLKKNCGAQPPGGFQLITRKATRQAARGLVNIAEDTE